MVGGGRQIERLISQMSADQARKWESGKSGPETPAAPTDPAINLALAQGPTAYTDAMRANLGFAPAGTAPAPAQPTGMAALSSQPFWASPVASTAPTLEQLLGVYMPPPAPAPPATPVPTTPAPTTPTRQSRPTGGLPFGYQRGGHR